MDISKVYGLVEDDLRKVEEEFDRNLASDVPLIPRWGATSWAAGANASAHCCCCSRRGWRVIGANG